MTNIRLQIYIWVDSVKSHWIPIVWNIIFLFDHFRHFGKCAGRSSPDGPSTVSQILSISVARLWTWGWCFMCFSMDDWIMIHYTYIYIHMYTCINIYTYIYIYTHTHCVHTHIYIYIAWAKSTSYQSLFLNQIWSTIPSPFNEDTGNLLHSYWTWPSRNSGFPIKKGGSFQFAMLQITRG